MSKINDLRKEIEAIEMRMLNAAHCFFIGDYLVVNLGRYLKYQKLNKFRDVSFTE